MLLTRSYRLGWKTVAKEVLYIVDQFQPDVVLANHSLVNGFVAFKIKAARGIPYVTVDHEVGDFFACRDNNRWLELMKPIANEASACITVSKIMQKNAEDVLPGIRFRTIYNGASFPPCDHAFLQRHVEKENLIVFCCGNLYGRKDIQLLIHGFDKIYGVFPKARLRIAGDGPDRDSLEKTVSELNSKDAIEFLGSAEHEEVKREMQAADIFALVGWAEPFGVAFLEAMANGCPVVVSEDAGVSEILEDGHTAIFTKPRNLESVISAIERLCESWELRRDIAWNGHRLFSQSCQWSSRAEEYADQLRNAALG